MECIFSLSNDGKYMWLNRVNDEYGMEIKNSRFGLIRTETGVFLIRSCYLNVFYLKYIVRDVGVVYICIFNLFDVFYDTDRNRKN